MIELTKLNHEKYYMNPNQIEVIEVTPDTLITMMNGKKYYAMESVEEVTKRIEAYYRRTAITVRTLNVDDLYTEDYDQYVIDKNKSSDEDGDETE